MINQPARSKYRKVHQRGILYPDRPKKMRKLYRKRSMMEIKKERERIYPRRISNSCLEIDKGIIGIKSIHNTSVSMSVKQINNMELEMKRVLKKTGKIWIRVNPNVPVTKKPIETRMGSGKSSPERWDGAIHPGSIFGEIGGSASNEVAYKAVARIIPKLPFKARPEYRRKTII